MKDETTAASAADLEAELDGLVAAFAGLRRDLEQVLLGQRDVVEAIVCALVADGHVLLESPPGLGKTTLARSIAQSCGLDFQRVQFTPDLMPGDILGARVLDEDENGRRRFVQHRGPIFSQVLLADEINRATPRTQSALLEAMQERQVTLYGETHPLDAVFIVLATQNPLEMEGTYPLPEAQLDRFLAKLILPTPGEDDLVRVLETTTAGATPALAARLDHGSVRRARALAERIAVPSDLVRRCARMVLASDPNREHAPDAIRTNLRYGSSPRGGQALMRLARAHAFVRGGLHVDEDDLAFACVPALRHRLVLNYEGEAQGVATDDLARLLLEHASA
jgi:MoxR-like ATPase